MKSINKSEVLKSIDIDVLDLFGIQEEGNAQLRDDVSRHIDEVAGYSSEELGNFIVSGMSRFQAPKNARDWLDGVLAGNALDIGSHKTYEEYVSMVYFRASMELSKRYDQYLSIIKERKDNDSRAKACKEMEGLLTIIESLLKKVAFRRIRVMSARSVAEDILKVKRLQNEVNEQFAVAKRVESTIKPGDKDPENRRTHEGRTMVSSDATVNEKKIDPSLLSLISKILAVSNIKLSGEKPAGIYPNGEASVKVESIETGISLACCSNYRISGKSGDTLRSVTMRETLILSDIVLKWLEDQDIPTRGRPSAIIDAFKELPEEKHGELNDKITLFLDTRKNHGKEGPRTDRVDCDLLNIVRLTCGAGMLGNRHDMSTRFERLVQARFAFEIVHNHETMYSFSDFMENYGFETGRSSIDSCVGRVARCVQPVYGLLYQQAITGKVATTDATTKHYFAFGSMEEIDEGRKRQRKQMKIQEISSRSDDGDIVFYMPLHSSNQKHLSMLLNNSGSRIRYLQSDLGPENIKTATALAGKGREFQEEFAEFLKENADDAELLLEMDALKDEFDRLKVRDIAENPLTLVACAAHAMTHLLKLRSLLDAFLSDAIMAEKDFAIESCIGSDQLDFVNDVISRLSDIYDVFTENRKKRGDSLEMRQELKPMFESLISLLSDKMDSAEYRTYFSAVRTQTEYVYDVITTVKDPFLECELVKLDSNDTERRMKPLLAIYGRCFHSGSFAGAMETCILLSLFETAENRGLNPLKYINLAYSGSLYLAGDIPTAEYFDILETAGIPLTDEKWVRSADLPKSYDDLLPTSDFAKKRAIRDEFVPLTADSIRELLEKRKRNSNG